MSITVTYPDAATFPVPLPAGTPSGAVSYPNSDIENLPTINFNVDKTTDSSFEVSATGQLAFDMIKFIEAIRNFDNTTVDPNDTVLNYITVGKGAHFDLVLTDDCCGTNSNLLFTGTADLDTVNYCSDDCTVNFTLLDSTEKGKILKCLSNRTFRERAVRDVMYNNASLLDRATGTCTNGGDCLDITAIRQCTNLKPNFIQYSILALFTLISPLVNLVLAIIAVILAIVALLNLIAGLFGLGPIAPNLSNSLLTIVSSITGFFTNCKPKNRPLAIRVKTYLNTICEVCNITGGFSNQEESVIASVWGDYTEYHITRQANERRQYNDVTEALAKNTVNINNVADDIFIDFLKNLETSFSIDTRIVFDAAGIPTLQLAPKRQIYNWFSSSSNAYIDLETSDYGGTTVNNRGFSEAIYCLDTREEPFPAGYFVRYKDDTGDENVGQVAEKHYYEDDILWGSDVNSEVIPVNSGFKGITEVNIPYSAAGSIEMDSSVSIYNSSFIDILSFLNPLITQFNTKSLITSKSSFSNPKLVYLEGTDTELPVFSTTTDALLSEVPDVNSLIFLGLKYRAFLKNSLFKSESALPIDFTTYLSRLNALKDIINLTGNITPLLFDTYFYGDVLGSDISYNVDPSNGQLEDNVYCEVPLYTGTIELKECSCDILQYFKTLTVDNNIPMIEFDGIGQFALDTVQINFDERQIILTGSIYGSRVFI